MSKYEKRPAPYTTIIADHKEPVFTVKSLNAIKNETQIGQFIKFHATSMDLLGHHVTKEICGTVIQKYPFIFLLDDGNYYKWVDYLISRVY